MHRIIEEKVNALTRSITDAMKCEEDIALVEELIADSWIWVDNEVNVSWSVKSKDDVKATLARFAKRGALLDRFVESETAPVWYLRGKNVTIRLCPMWHVSEAEGVTCRLVQIGEETVQRPVYKLICDEKEGEEDA